MIRRMNEMKKLFQESQAKLNDIISIPNYDLDYITAQWKRQRDCQLKAICSESTQALTEKLAHLIDLEEFLQATQAEFNTLRRKRRRTQTQQEDNRLLRLPRSLLLLEEEIDEVVDELGAQEFRNIPGASSARGRGMIRIRVSKGKLYEAKVGVLEEQKQANMRAGITRQVLAFNTSFPGPNPIECLTFDEVKGTSIDHPFWDFGQITHPQEPWAVDPRVQGGIRAHLYLTHSEDELRRIGRECRQLINWSVDTYDKISTLREIIYSEDELPDLEQNKWIMGILNLNTCRDEALSERKKVLEALLRNLDQTHGRLWMGWNRGIQTVISGNLEHSDLSSAEESEIMTNWNRVVKCSRLDCEGIIEAQVIRAEGIDEPVDDVEEYADEGLGPEVVGDPDEVYDNGNAYWVRV
ncbi:hypothetical protein DFH28DRAFT_882242 [Melampsora americana]|nr:hypothetical protein DFH28DRAFT_882242 [Melampsora americana]